MSRLTSAATIKRVSIALALSVLVSANAADLKISTDFEGGSARVTTIDQETRTIQFMPGGDPQRGWPCWWYFRVDGLSKDEKLTLHLRGSDRPARQDSKETGKPLAEFWAMPARASYSSDNKAWKHTTPPVKREGGRIIYEITGTGQPLWVAWGPPFTPRDADTVLAEAEKRLKSAKSFTLTKTSEGRAVRGLHINEPKGDKVPAIWINARQHAWESGASWVARGLIEWLTSSDEAAVQLRKHAEIFVVPIMDVDNAATGNGGKEANPRDHNRDWDAKPVYPEIAATQERIREFAKAERMALFIDLHNPAPADAKPFFFVGPEELLSETGRTLRANFISLAKKNIAGPLPLDEKVRVTGPSYHPLWKQISGQWVNANGNPHTVAVCLETSWNTEHSTTEGYRTVGRQLGKAVAEFMKDSKP